MSYQYTGSSTDIDNGDDRSSQNHELEQVYHVGIDYAILSRRLANGTLELDLGTNQVYNANDSISTQSDSDVGLSLEFLFDMVLFERRPYTVNLMANRIDRLVSAPFTERYTLTTSLYAAGLTLRHKLFPVKFDYRRFSSETDGLTVDRKQETDEFTAESNLRWGNHSDTNLRARVGSTSTDFEGINRPTVETDNYDLTGQNILSWGSLLRKNTLTSRYQLRRDSGSSELRSEQINEDLELQLGEGLSVGGSYDYLENITPEQEREEHKRAGWLEHRLYDSLTSRYTYSESEIAYLTGNEDNFIHIGSLNYVKKLPKKSTLGLSYSYSYGETDRDLDEQRLFVADEIKVLDGFGSAFLTNPDVILASVVVYTADRSSIYPPSDYTLNRVGRRTEIVLPLAANQAISVDYSHLIDGSIEYSTTTHAVSASLGLFNQQYRLYTNLSFSDQDLISGNDTVSPLTQSTFVQVGFEGGLEQTTYGGQYMYLDSSISEDHTYEAFLNYLKPLDRSILTLRLTERYLTTRSKPGFGLIGTSGETESRNSVLLNADYRRPLRRNTTLNLRGQFADVRGESRDQNDLSLGMTLEARWYKFEFLMTGDVSWSLYENTTAREDLLYLKLRRYF